MMKKKEKKRYSVRTYSDGSNAEYAFDENINISNTQKKIIKKKTNKSKNDNNDVLQKKNKKKMIWKKPTKKHRISFLNTINEIDGEKLFTYIHLNKTTKNPHTFSFHLLLAKNYHVHENGLFYI